ncbi:MAG TPA: wax ester/triacylglycerol synthase domain-containing protein [Nocardioidaceae bacterium]|nr:wax ester/triacylglycerol synthase domain-containing protein [Nocardioidaceae bacterium]
MTSPQGRRRQPHGEGPHRVLVVSADMGGGHNATAAAIEQEVHRLWPGSETRRVDALDVMGRGVGRLFRAIYVANVEQTPWLYEFFYASLWRHRWFAQASKRFTGSWCGRLLASEIDHFDPDLVASTYPLGSAGLAWLRRHRGLAQPTAAWVSDFSPHPFWVYADLDINFVMHPSAVSAARCAEAEATVEVCAPPVVDAFSPGDRARARDQLGLPSDTFVVLLSCGAYAFGDIAATVDELLASSADLTVVAACGRNEGVRRHLEGLGLPRERMLALGWTDDMATVVQASDLVLSNAGGATALEAFATGVPVMMARPIAAHGKANAELMTTAGLAELCSSDQDLAARLRSLTTDRGALADMQRRTREYAAGATVDIGVRRLADCRLGRAEVSAPTAARRPWPMRASDAFFTHVETPRTRQELGAVVEIGPTSAGAAVTVAAVRRQLQARVAGLPPARRVLRRRPPGWVLRDEVDVCPRIVAHELAAGATAADISQALGDFWSRGLPADEPAWQILFIHGPDRHESQLAVKMHHSMGDGISALGLLDRLLDPLPGDPLVERRPAPVRRRRRSGPRQVVRGLGHLATRGTAPRHPLNRQPTTDQRHVVTVDFPAAELQRLARDHDVHLHELVVALAADALDRVLRPAGLLTDGKPLRAMVPVTTRLPRLDRIFGNWTGSLALDLPMGPMPLAWRSAAVRREARRRALRGEALAAAVVMRAAGALPAPAHRVLARLAYHRRFFSTVVSYMPGPRRPRECAGGSVRAIYPVLPLPPGVPITVGAVVAGGVVGIGVVVDRGVEVKPTDIEGALRSAFLDARESVGSETGSMLQNG